MGSVMLSSSALLDRSFGEAQALRSFLPRFSSVDRIAMATIHTRDLIDNVVHQSIKRDLMNQ